MSFTSSVKDHLDSVERDLQEIIAVFSDDPDKEYVLDDSLFKKAYSEMLTARKSADLGNIRTLFAYRAAITNLCQILDQYIPGGWKPYFNLAQSKLDQSIFT